MLCSEYRINFTVRRLALLFVLMVFGFALHAQRALTDEQTKRYQPPATLEYFLSSQPFELKDSTVISVSAVYVSKQYLCAEKCDTLYNFMRFYSDGRVFVSFEYKSYPSVDEIKDDQYGKFGRYVVQMNQIKVELYQSRQHGIEFMHAKPVNDGLRFFKTTRTVERKQKVYKGKDNVLYKKNSR